MLEEKPDTYVYGTKERETIALWMSKKKIILTYPNVALNGV